MIAGLGEKEKFSTIQHLGQLRLSSGYDSRMVGKLLPNCCG